MATNNLEYQLNTVRIRLVPDIPLFSDRPVNSPDDAADLMARELADWDREVVCVLNRDVKGRVLSMNVVSIGALSEAQVHPREVFKSAVLSNAAAVILMHNHPSGDIQPSVEDVMMTTRMQESGEILGIPVQDHIIVGSGGDWYSMREHGEMDSKSSLVAEVREGQSKYSVNDPSKRDKRSYREKVKERFVRSLQENPLSWKKEWSSNETGRPYNMGSGYAYKGLNAFFLKFMEITMEYRDPRWLTFRQAADAGYKIPKGTKMAPVEYFFMFDTKNRKTVTWKDYNKLTEAEKKEIIVDPDGTKQNRYILRSKEHYVFNAAQLEGVPELDRKNEYHEINASEVVQAVARGMEVEINEKEQGRAFYSPLTDSITLPLKEQFESDYAYQSTALHELGHATGHESRLGRDIEGSFGSTEYAYEELIAEITSCFMGEYLPVEAGEEDINNHVAYVQNWLEAIDKDPNYLFKAIKAADQAADYMISKGDLETLKERFLKESEQGIEYWHYSIEVDHGDGLLREHYSSLEQLKQGLEEYDLPESLANFEGALNAETNMAVREHGEYKVVAYAMIPEVKEELERSRVYREEKDCDIEI